MVGFWTTVVDPVQLLWKVWARKNCRISVWWAAPVPTPGEGLLVSKLLVFHPLPLLRPKEFPEEFPPHHLAPLLRPNAANCLCFKGV